MEKNENANGENEAAGFIAARLGGFFAFMLEICDDADKISHTALLASFRICLRKISMAVER